MWLNSSKLPFQKPVLFLNPLVKGDRPGAREDVGDYEDSRKENKTKQTKPAFLRLTF